MKYFLASILLTMTTAAAAFSQSSGGGRLGGSWDAVVTPRVCATGNAITTFQAAYNFDLGGSFSAVSAGTGSGGRGREQVGVWKHVTGNRYLFRLKTFLFNAADQVTGYQIVTHDAELNDDASSWSSAGISQTFTLDDIQTASGCSTIVATRLAEL